MLLKQDGVYNISSDIIGISLLNKNLEVKDKESYKLTVNIINKLLKKGLDCGCNFMYFKEREDINNKIYYGFYEDEFIVLDAYIKDNVYEYYVDSLEIFNIIVGLREEYNGECLEKLVWHKVCNLN